MDNFILSHCFITKFSCTICLIGTKLTRSSATAERPCNAPVTSIRKIAKWNFWTTLLGCLGET